MTTTLPKYAKRLDAFHQAFAREFKLIVHRLPLEGQEILLDAGCGDGFFTTLIANAHSELQVIALDNSRAYLEAATERIGSCPTSARISLVEGDVKALPNNIGDFDTIWSAHSMQSYAQIPQVLREFHRVLRRHGLLAILETDNIHSVMLSWPPNIELAIRQAEQAEIDERDSFVGNYFPRFAHQCLREAGFGQFSREYFILHSQPECSRALEEYIQLYIEDLVERIGSKLPSDVLQVIHNFAVPSSGHFLPYQENFFFGSIQTLFTARALKP